MSNLKEKGNVMNNNEDEALGFFDRLLERLHQADLTNFGSQIQLVYVAPGAQHVDKQFVFGEKNSELQILGQVKRQSRARTSQSPNSCVPSVASDQRSSDKFDGTELLPEVLRTDKAMALWRKVQQAGYVDEHYQPLLSRTQAALLADAMAGRLGIKEKWKVFETLWNRKYMRSDYNLALTRKRSLDFQDILKQLFG